MTVSELIAHLKTLEDQDAVVVVVHDFYVFDMKTVFNEKRYVNNHRVFVSEKNVPKSEQRQHNTYPAYLLFSKKA